MLDRDIVFAFLALAALLALAGFETIYSWWAVRRAERAARNRPTPRPDFAPNCEGTPGSPQGGATVDGWRTLDDCHRSRRIITSTSGAPMGVVATPSQGVTYLEDESSDAAVRFAAQMMLINQVQQDELSRQRDDTYRAPQAWEPPSRPQAAEEDVRPMGPTDAELFRTVDRPVEVETHSSSSSYDSGSSSSDSSSSSSDSSGGGSDS